MPDNSRIPELERRDFGDEIDGQAGPRLLAGKYRLGRLIGEGGMGAVYEAVHVGLGVKVAVKLLNPSFTSNEKAVSRFRREARTAAAVRHENIVTVTDTDCDEEGVPFIVMELLEGESLNSLIRRERSLRAEVTAAIAAQVLEGLAAAHERGVIHRDLKPGNVVLARERSGAFRVKILDFGISKFVADELHTHENVTATGAVIGTPRFMAPEQARGQTDLDARCDLYAVGLMMYTMLTGKLPFSGASPEEITQHILTGNFLRPRQVRPEIPEALERVIVRAMATDREDRFQDARSFLAALKTAMPILESEIELTAQTTMGLGSSPTPTPKRTGGPISVQIPIIAAPLDLEAESQAVSGVRTVAATPKAMPRGSTTPPRSSRRGMFLGLSVIALLGLASFAMWRYWLGPRLVGEVTPVVAPPQTPTGPPFRFGITKYLSEERVREVWMPFTTYLQTKLQRPVELVVVEPYIDLAALLESGKLDLAALSPYAYVRAKREKPDLILLAKPVDAGGPSYEGVILTRAESGIEKLSDLEGKLFCYVNQTSTSGYLYPRAIFRRAGMDPDKAFSATRFTGDHQAGLKALESGACDGAAVYMAAWIEAGKMGIAPETFKPLAFTERIPYDAYTVSPKTDPALVERLKESLLSLEPGGAAALEVFKGQGQIRGFVVARDADYDGTRAIEGIEHSPPAAPQPPKSSHSP